MDYDDIVQKRVRRIARDHGCSVAEANAALDHHPVELDRDTFLKRTLAMELVELVPAFTAYGIEYLKETIAMERAAGRAPPPIGSPK